MLDIGLIIYHITLRHFTDIGLIGLPAKIVKMVR